MKLRTAGLAPPECLLRFHYVTSTSMLPRAADCGGSQSTGFLLKKGQGGTTATKVRTAPPRRMRRAREMSWVEYPTTKATICGGVSDWHGVAAKTETAYAGSGEQGGGQELGEALAVEVLGSRSARAVKLRGWRRTIWPSKTSRAFSSSSSAMLCRGSRQQSCSQSMMKLRRCSTRSGPTRLVQRKGGSKSTSFTAARPLGCTLNAPTGHSIRHFKDLCLVL